MNASVISLNGFYKLLSGENQERIKEAKIGTPLIIQAKDNSIINGIIDGFEGDDLIMNIGRKSMVAITSSSVMTINIKKMN